MGCVFISHIEEDQSLALEIAAGLEAAGFETWYYERDSEPGLSYLIQVHEAIERCVAFVLLISPGSVKSHQMTKEVVRANDLGKPFLPVRHKISHAVFQEEQPEWNIAIGAAASIPIPEKGVAQILPRIVRGLEALTSSKEDEEVAEPPVHRKRVDDEGTREREEDSVAWLEAAQAWTKRHRFPVAGSAAVVLVLIYLAQLPEPVVPSQAEPPASVALTPNAAPATQPTTAPAVSNVPSGVIEAERPNPGAGNGAGAPATGRATTVRTNPAVKPSSTGTGRRTTAPSLPTTAPSTTTTQPTANNPVVETSRRSAPDDGGVVARLPVSPVNAPVAAGPPAAAAGPPPAAGGPPAAAPPPANAAIIPQTPTAAALVNQTIEEYEKAAESLDLAEVRRVWPAAPDALRTSYRNLRSQIVNLDCGEPTITTDMAMVSCREQVRSVGAGGITLPVANNTARFFLRRNGGAWQISSISRGN